MDAVPCSAAVICAAGASVRMGGLKKEYQKLESSSLTVLGSAVSAFAAVPAIGTIVIAVPENGEEDARRALPPYCLSAKTPRVLFVNGGSTRRVSVFNALSLLSDYSPRYVLIHDGARPWINPSLIEEVIDAVKKHGAVIPLLSLTDTPKECDAPFETAKDGDAPAVFIKTHLKRAVTGIAQTPQAFLFPEILLAHEKAAFVHEEFTDDAEIWGRFCGQVAAIQGSSENRKITFLEDFQN